MRREDRNRIALQRRLAGFKGIYEQKAEEWLASYTSNLGTATEHVYLFPEDHILKLMPDEYADIVEQMKPYHWTDELHEFAKILQPTTDKVKEQAEDWHRKAWRKKYLNFRDIPKALPFRLDKIDSRTYTVNGLTIKISGHGKRKEVTILLQGGKVLCGFGIECAHLSDVPAMILSRLKRVAALCDWTVFESCSLPVQRAVGKRFIIVKEYYDDPASYRYRLSCFARKA